MLLKLLLLFLAVVVVVDYVIEAIISVSCCFFNGCVMIICTKINFDFGLCHTNKIILITKKIKRHFVDA